MSRRVHTDIGQYNNNNAIAYQDDDSQFDHNAAYAKMHEQQDSPCDFQEQQQQSQKYAKQYGQQYNKHQKYHNYQLYANEKSKKLQQDDQEQQNFENYKGIYFNDDAGQKFQDPQTGAHFEYTDMCRRLNCIIQREKRKEAMLYGGLGGVTLTEPVQKLKLCQEIEVPQEGVKSKEFTGSLRFKNKFDQGSGSSGKAGVSNVRPSYSLDKNKQLQKPIKMAQISAAQYKSHLSQYQQQGSANSILPFASTATVGGGGTGGSGGTRNYSNSVKFQKQVEQQQQQQQCHQQNQNLKDLLMNYKNLSNYQQQQILQKVMRGKSNSSNGVSQNNYDLTGGMKNSNTYGGGNNNNNEYLKTIMQKYQKSGLVGSYSVQKKLQQQHLQQNNHSNGGKSPNILKKSVNAGYSSIEKNKKNISMSGNKKERMASYEGRRLYEEMLERWVKFSNSIFYRTLDKKKKVAQATQQRVNTQANNQELNLKTEGNDLLNLYHQKKRNLGLSSGRSIQIQQQATSQSNPRKIMKNSQRKSQQIPISLSSTGYGQKSRNNQNVRNGSSYGQTPVTKSNSGYYHTGQMGSSVRTSNNIKSYATLQQLNYKSVNNKYSNQGSHLNGSKSQVGVLIPKKPTTNAPKTYMQNNYNYRVPSTGIMGSNHYTSGSASQLQSALFHSSSVSKPGQNPNNLSNNISSNNRKDIKSGSADKRKSSLTKGTYQSYSSSIKQQARKKPTFDSSERVTPLLKSSSKYGMDKFSKSSYGRP